MLWGLFVAKAARPGSGARLSAGDVLDKVAGGERLLQVGGKATTGCGLSRLVPLGLGTGGGSQGQQGAPS